MVWKLSVLACLSEQAWNHNPLLYPEIQKRHVMTATKWYMNARENLDKVLYFAHKSRETISLDRTLEIIRKHGNIQRSNLLTGLSRLGVKAHELNSIIMTLIERGQIVQGAAGRAITYTIRKRKGM